MELKHNLIYDTLNLVTFDFESLNLNSNFENLERKSSFNRLSNLKSKDTENEKPIKTDQTNNDKSSPETNNTSLITLFENEKKTEQNKIKDLVQEYEKMYEALYLKELSLAENKRKGNFLRVFPPEDTKSLSKYLELIESAGNIFGDNIASKARIDHFKKNQEREISTLTKVKVTVKNQRSGKIIIKTQTPHLPKIEKQKKPPIVKQVYKMSSQIFDGNF